MPQNRTMDWLLVIVPGFLSIKFFLEKDMIYGVVWGIASILYLMHALSLLKKDREAAKNGGSEIQKNTVDDEATEENADIKSDTEAKLQELTKTKL